MFPPFFDFYNPLSLKKLTLVTHSQSWALALFFQVRSPLIFLPRIAIALALILKIFRFAHRSSALKKTAVRSWKRALKRKIAPKKKWFALGKER